MKTSDAGKFALAMHEGIVPAPYKDSVGVWTFGIGHTAAAGAPDPATLPRGMPADLDRAIKRTLDLFGADLTKYEAAVNAAVKVPLKQHEFDALVSFHYNTGAIARATLTKRLNAGDRKGAAAGFMNWTKPASLKARRQAEASLFANGAYPGGTVPVWQADSTGRVIWKPIRRIGMTEFLQMLGARIVETPAPAPTPSAPKPARPGAATGAGIIIAILAAIAAYFVGK